MKKEMFLVFISLLLIPSSVFAQVNNGVPEDIAITALMRADADIREMQSFKLSTNYVNDLFYVAKLNYVGTSTEHILVARDTTPDRVRRDFLDSLLATANETPYFEIVVANYSQVIQITQDIADTKKKAYELLDSLSVFTAKVSAENASGFNITDPFAIYLSAKSAFEEERYVDARKLLDDAEIRLDQVRLEEERRATILNITSSFIERFWPYLLAALIILIIIGKPLFKRAHKAYAAQKIKNLNFELQSLMKLLKQAQTDCFDLKKITQSTYHVKADSYIKRIEEIKQEIPLLEEIISGSKTKSPKVKKGEGLVIK